MGKKQEQFAQRKTKEKIHGKQTSQTYDFMHD
jgi:hypothetical protein